MIVSQQEIKVIRMLCSWYPVFDDGELNEDPENARKEVEALVTLMKGSNHSVYTAKEYPLRYVFQSVWQRITQVRPTQYI